MTWDPPGDHEGLGIREQPLLGSAWGTDADLAVWDVTHHSGWPALAGPPVEDVTMHYEDWGRPGEGFWCQRISLQIATTRVDFLLAEGQMDDAMRLSADNVAVTFTTTDQLAAQSEVATATVSTALRRKRTRLDQLNAVPDHRLPRPGPTLTDSDRRPRSPFAPVNNYRINFKSRSVDCIDGRMPRGR